MTDQTRVTPRPSDVHCSICGTEDYSIRKDRGSRFAYCNDCGAAFTGDRKAKWRLVARLQRVRDCVERREALALFNDATLLRHIADLLGTQVGEKTRIIPATEAKDGT